MKPCRFFTCTINNNANEQPIILENPAFTGISKYFGYNDEWQNQIKNK